jgi:hypothetical protein
LDKKSRGRHGLDWTGLDLLLVHSMHYRMPNVLSSAKGLVKSGVGDFHLPAHNIDAPLVLLEN